MSGYEPAALSPVEVAAAGSLRRLSEKLVTHDIGDERAAEVELRLRELIEMVEQSPRRNKTEAFAKLGGHDRMAHFAATGRWPAPPPDGDEVTFDALSFVGGQLNPISAGLQYHRDGDEAVGVGTISACFEGPPDRVHGGMVASAFDEVMGAVFRVRQLPSTFTGTLSVRYVGAAPLNTELTFRARLTGIEGRKHFVEATGTGPDGVFATAEATFIQMSEEHIKAAGGLATTADEG